MRSYLPSDFVVRIDWDRCIKCLVCVKQCSYGALYYDKEADFIWTKNKNCTACHRCVSLCPTEAIWVEENSLAWKRHAIWSPQATKAIWKQAETGSVLLTSCGNELPYPDYFDRILLDASQVTNPSIDPLREPMELRTFLGAKPQALGVEEADNQVTVKTKIAPQVKLETPIMFAAMSLGAVSYNVHRALAESATELGTLYNTGEGGLHRDLYQFGDNTIVQVASGRFGVHHEYLNSAAMVEIKIGQGAKPGIGGHLPAEKVSAEISETRMIPEGTDALSPAPHHDIYSIEDLSQLVYAIKEATNYEKPVAVKIAAVHNSAAICGGMVRAGADVVVLDGFRGGTGAAPQVVRDHVGIPIELAIAAVDDRLRQEGIRNQASIVASGGIRSSADVIKAIALGADAVYIGTAALIALGCHVCQSCHTNKCAWGICTQNPTLTKRQNPDVAKTRLMNLVRGWSLEIKEVLGAMGINAIESLRGNRLRLRGIGLSDTELEILGIRHAGR